MLLEFSVENFKSLKDEIVFSMLPDENIKFNKSSLLSEMVGSEEAKALSVSLIYGPNAVGKSNLIEALHFLKDLITDESFLSRSPEDIQYIPNFTLTDSKPTVFNILFTENSKLYEYTLEIDLGTFVQKSDVKIVFEELKLNEKVLYRRKYNEVISLSEKVNLDLNLTVKNQELFLRTGFKLVFPEEILSDFLNWFEKKLIFIDPNIHPKVEFKEYDLKRYTDDPVMKEFVRDLGSNSSNIGYSTPSEKTNERMISTIELSDGSKAAVSSRFVESTGTIKMVDYLLDCAYAVKMGATIVIDEFDSSFEMLMGLRFINLFKDEEVNQNNAQAIFITRNPVYMNAFTLRPDEFNFMDWRDGGEIEMYSLSDFSNPESSENYLENYLEQQYGAIRGYSNERFEELRDNICLIDQNDS